MARRRFFASPTRLARKLIGRIALTALLSLGLSFGLAYAVFWPRLEQEAHDSAAAACRYLTLNIDEAISSLSGYAAYMASSPELADAVAEHVQAPGMENFHQVCQVLTELSGLSANIRTVALEGPMGYFQASGLLGEEDRQLMASSWYQTFNDGAYPHAWSSFYLSNADYPVNTLAQAVPCRIGEDDCVLTVFYNADGLMEVIDALAGSAYTGYLLTDYHHNRPGVPFYQQGSLGNLEAVAQEYEGQSLYSTSDASGHYFLASIPSSGWVFGGYIDTASFNSTLTPFVWLLLAVCLALGLMLVLLLAPAVDRLLAPLGKLRETMQRVSHEGPDFYSPVQTDDEIGQLSDVFNDMLDELRINAEKELEEKRRGQQLRYNLMLAQIHSHFFYNALSTINSLARQGRCQDVIRANTALTVIFQDCLRAQSLALGDTVRQERRVVECYWSIQTLDPSNRCLLDWDVPPELEEARIPKNIIQPLVENALFHGLDNAQTGTKEGRIQVSLHREGAELVLQVENDGTPIDPVLLERLNHPVPEPEETEGVRHIGLQNIRRRLFLLYGEEASLHIASGAVTTVTIRMPAAPPQPDGPGER